MISTDGLAKLRILVVEDDEDMGENLQRILTLAGYQVHLARDGAEAITVLQTQPFHLVLTDLLMPRMGGLELLGEIRRLGPSLPVVFLSAFGKQAAFAKAMDLGAAGFVTKPFRANSLLRLIQAILDQR
ncbi:MAG: acetoacetate metabolism regulatory protein AtoC [candidate division NC10 bacterium CSP1-5]|nr:MAG: acetoacetate metabolism regulatory protein AtoC [candidate division NC10 bacterium CSP1-5]